MLLTEEQKCSLQHKPNKHHSEISMARTIRTIQQVFCLKKKTQLPRDIKKAKPNQISRKYKNKSQKTFPTLHNL